MTRSDVLLDVYKESKENDFRIELVGFFTHLKNNGMVNFSKIMDSHIEEQTDSVIELSSVKSFATEEEAIKVANSIASKAKSKSDHGYLDVVEAISMSRIEILDW